MECYLTIQVWVYVLQTFIHNDDALWKNLFYDHDDCITIYVCCLCWKTSQSDYVMCLQVYLRLLNLLWNTSVTMQQLDLQISFQTLVWSIMPMNMITFINDLVAWLKLRVRLHGPWCNVTSNIALIKFLRFSIQFNGVFFWKSIKIVRWYPIFGIGAQPRLGNPGSVTK